MFASVSAVVKVFEATTTSVVAGSSVLTASSNASPSMFDRKRTLSLARRRPSASTSSAGPSTEPPMPMCSTPVTLPNAPASIASTSARVRCRRSGGEIDVVGSAAAALGDMGRRPALRSD